MSYPWTYDEIASLPSLLRYASGPELKQLERDLALSSPATFAMTSSRGRWQLARHLACLDQAILESIDEAAKGKLDGLAIAMPPRCAPAGDRRPGQER